MRFYRTKESAGAAFNAVLDKAEHSVFKLGVRQNYEDEDNSASWGAWCNGAYEDSMCLVYQEQRYIDWMSRCMELRNRGVKFTRAQVIDVPLSNYAQWSLSVFRQYEEVGAERVVTVKTEQVRDLALPATDFIIADNTQVLQWEYVPDTQGEVLGAQFIEPADGVKFTAYLALRDVILNRAVPLTPDW